MKVLSKEMSDMLLAEVGYSTGCCRICYYFRSAENSGPARCEVAHVFAAQVDMDGSGHCSLFSETSEPK
jgi:hypothetical protein